jgi:hypothetical protein
MWNRDVIHVHKGKQVLKLKQSNERRPINVLRLLFIKSTRERRKWQDEDLVEQF